MKLVKRAFWLTGMGSDLGTSFRGIKVDNTVHCSLPGTVQGMEEQNTWMLSITIYENANVADATTEALPREAITGHS